MDLCKSAERESNPHALRRQLPKGTLANAIRQTAVSASFTIGG